MQICLAVDVMSGDLGLNATLAGIEQFLQTKPVVSLILFGNAQLIKSHHSWKNSNHLKHCMIEDTSEMIEMDESIQSALRHKKRSSMRLAIEAVKAKQANACISSGNTGALMALAHYVLKTLPNIERPAIATLIPNQKQTGTIMLDLGANADCSAEHLYQFAWMGKAMALSLYGIKEPSIGLLNIGEEVIKGNETVKQASKLLQASPLNFYGNVEGNDIFKGTTDVVVCDGFVGNIALKTAEGVAKMLSLQLKQGFNQSILRKLMAVICYPVLKQVKYTMDHRRYNGAMLLGLNGLVIKSHGSADAFAFCNALNYAMQACKQGIRIEIPDIKTI